MKRGTKSGQGALSALRACALPMACCLLLGACGKMPGEQAAGGPNHAATGEQAAGGEQVTGGPEPTAGEDMPTEQGTAEPERPGAAGQEPEKEEEKVPDHAAYFEDMELTKGYKGLTDVNPIMTQRFGADPYAMAYGDRVYFYMTADAFEYDAKGEIAENSYGKIRSINVVSTDDMVNFTDHGSIAAAGKDGAAPWAANSWAPAAAWKEIDGKVKFFLYFADNGGGIGVLESDSPTGPFVDPIGRALVSRKTPNCADVLWLFDPAVLVDDDGRAYLYFGGGVPEGRTADPGTARVVELGEDMVSLKGEPVRIDVPYLFEDSGIHKAGEKYYYTYCSNWQVDDEGAAKYGFHSAEIVSMESDSPMGPFTVKERILENPGKYFGLYGNNHHCVFRFQDRWYITYHTRALEKAMGIEHGYRCTHVSQFTMGEDGVIGTVRQSLKDREQLRYVDPYGENSAVNMALNAGLDTRPADDSQSGDMILTGIDNGDYMKVQGVDFGERSPETLEMWLKASGEQEEGCVVRVSLDYPNGTVVGYLSAEACLPPQAGETDEEGFVLCAVSLEQEVTGVHDLFFVFSGSGYEVRSWKFSGEGCKSGEAVN